MTRQEEYRAYLRSQEWKSLSLLARMRAGNACEFCGAYGDHVHHVKYPKRFSEDHIDNLIVVCEYHHSVLHGIRGDIMSGDIQIIGGVETLKSNDDVIWFDFQQIFEKFRDTVGAFEGNAWIAHANTQKSGVWNMVNEEYKKREKINDICGRDQYRYWVSEPGVHQIAAQWRTPKTKAFQKWLYEEVIPQIRKTGKYSCEPDMTGSPHTILAKRMAEQALSLAAAFEKQDRLELEQKLLKEKQDELNDKVEKHEAILQKQIKRFDDMTGGDFASTARQYLMENGINPEVIYSGNMTIKYALGQYCSKWHKENNVPMPPKIPEGTYMVGVWSRDALKDGVKALGIKARSSVH